MVRMEVVEEIKYNLFFENMIVYMLKMFWIKVFSCFFLNILEIVYYYFCMRFKDII